MTDKQLFIDILNLFKNQHNINKNQCDVNKTQKLFNDLTTQKFNEIIDFVNDLEKRVIILESKKNKKWKWLN